MNWILEPLDGPVADTLDLHGMTWSQAEPAVVAFLNRIRKRQRGALVHIITGKGRGSPGPVAIRCPYPAMTPAHSAMEPAAGAI